MDALNVFLNPWILISVGRSCRTMVMTRLTISGDILFSRKRRSICISPPLSLLRSTEMDSDLTCNYINCMIASQGGEGGLISCWFSPAFSAITDLCRLLLTS